MLWSRHERLRTSFRGALTCDAVQVWRDMRGRGIEGNEYVYAALIDACERANDWKNAVAIFNDMQARPPRLCAAKAVPSALSPHR